MNNTNEEESLHRQDQIWANPRGIKTRVRKEKEIQRKGAYGEITRVIPH